MNDEDFEIDELLTFNIYTTIVKGTFVEWNLSKDIITIRTTEDDYSKVGELQLVHKNHLIDRANKKNN